MAKKSFDIAIYSKDSPFKKTRVSFYFKKILQCLPQAQDLSWSISIVSDKDIKKINKKYKNKDKATDVLAFFYPEGDPQAEIIISSEMAVNNAPDYGNSSKEEFLTYLIHGVLHILGYNDIRKGQKKIMFKRQGEILKKIL